MTLIEGSVEDVGMTPMSGVLTVRTARFRPSGEVLYAPEAIPFPIVNGQVTAELAPGPAVLTVKVGSHAQDRFEVVIPDQVSITLADLIETVFSWEPEQINKFITERKASEAAAIAAGLSAAAAVAAKDRAILEHEHVHLDAAHVDAVAAQLPALLEQANVFAQDQVPPYLQTAALNATYVPQSALPALATKADLAAAPTPPVAHGTLTGLSLLADSTGRGVYWGDSERGIGGNTVSVQAMSWLTWATRLSAGRLSRGVNASIIGNTLAQMNARVQSDIIDHPDRTSTAVAVCSGYNDAYANVTVAQYMTTFAEIHAKLSAVQIEMIACTPLPTANGPAVNARMAEYSTAIRQYAKDHGLYLIDLRALTIDPATGGMIASVRSNGDGVHPGDSGQMELGKLALGSLRNRLPRFGAHPISLWGAKSNLTPNRTFVGEPTAAGLAPGVFVYGAAVTGVVTTVVPGDGLIEGNWQRITHTAATGVAKHATRITPTAGRVVAGDRLAIAGLVSASGPLAVNITPDWGRAPYGESAFRVREVTFGATPFYSELTVPAGFSQAYLDFIIETGWTGQWSGQVNFAQLGVYNLTRSLMLN